MERRSVLNDLIINIEATACHRGRRTIYPLSFPLEPGGIFSATEFSTCPLLIHVIGAPSPAANFGSSTCHLWVASLLQEVQILQKTCRNLTFQLLLSRSLYLESRWLQPILPWFPESSLESSQLLITYFSLVCPSMQTKTVCGEVVNAKEFNYQHLQLVSTVMGVSRFDPPLWQTVSV